MKTNRTVARFLSYFIFVCLVHLCLLGNVTVSRASEYEAGKCDFSLQLLNDPYQKESFLASLLEARSATGDIESMYKYIATVRGEHGELVGIDSFSHNCVSCHDGMNAPYHAVRFRNSGERRFIDMQTVVGSHPIGMNYEEYATSNQEFKSFGSLHPDMSLVAGKIGCLTCHNPLNPQKYHLATTDEKSNMCLACHVK